VHFVFQREKRVIPVPKGKKKKKKMGGGGGKNTRGGRPSTSRYQSVLEKQQSCVGTGGGQTRKFRLEKERNQKSGKRRQREPHTVLKGAFFCLKKEVSN